MPTGYTADIYDGKDVSLKDFAAGCARAFGVFMHQRDESATAVLRYPEKNNYPADTLAKYEAEQDAWNEMGRRERISMWEEKISENLKAYSESTARRLELRRRYSDMLEKVEAVDVPPELANFKAFMVKQLNESMEFDAPKNRSFTDSYYHVPDFNEWEADHTEFLNRMVNSYREDVINANERYRESVRYINLMSSTFGFEVEGKPE